MKCRLCNNTTKEFLSLGNIPLPEEFRTGNKIHDPVITFPLGLSYCTDCGHVQLTSKINPDVIYKQNYFYDYSIMEAGRKHWEKLAADLFKRYNLKKSDLIVDVGSNTGILLKIFQKFHVQVLGVDPSPSLAEIAEKQNIPTIVDYFTPTVAKKTLKKHGRAKIITCTNVFDHVDDLHVWTEAVKMLLDPSGIGIVEVPYFPDFLQRLSHVVYHQQIDYMSLTPLLPFFQNHGLKVIDAELIPFHGGSIRLYISSDKRMPVSERIENILKDEFKYFNNRSTVLRHFTESLIKQKSELSKMLHRLKKDNAKIAAAGASAKGITLLNYCGIGPETIDFISEKSKLKVGRYTPSGIPIKTDRDILDTRPNYVLLLAWNFRDEIVKNLKGYKGQFIIPVPNVIISSSHN